MSSILAPASLQNLKLSSRQRPQPEAERSPSKVCTTDTVYLSQIQQLEGDGKQSQPQCTQQQLFELLRLLPYNQPEEAVDACLLLSACGGHGLGAQLASDIHKAVSATRSTLVQQTNWFLGCALLVANAGVMTRLETVSEHNTRLVEACRKEHPLPFSAPTLRLRIVRQTKGKVLLSKK